MATHRHHHRGRPHRALAAALFLTFGFAGIEAVGGWWSGSLALLGDAGHMVTDSLSLGLALAAARLALRPPSARHSYGLGRTETLAALANALLMIAIIAWISAEAVERLQRPIPVRGEAVTAVALVGLLVNLAAAWLLSGEHANLNVRAALLHVLGDLLGSLAALSSGVVILYTGWTTIDPLLSLAIAGLLLYFSLRLLSETLTALMEGVPPGLQLEAIGQALAGLEGVLSVHDLHVWALSAERLALSAHLVVDDVNRWERLLPQARLLLREEFGIEHVTLQPEPTTQTIPIHTPRRR